MAFLDRLLSNPTAAKIGGKVGRAIDLAGSVTKPFQPFNLPDLNLSERLQSIGGQAYASEGNYRYSQPTSGEVQGTMAPPPGYSPSTSGQSAGSSGTLNLTPPSTDGGGQQDDGLFNRLRDAYGVARRGIEGQAPILDQSYNLSKGDIQSSINQSVEAAENQKGQLETQFGDVLKNQLRTYQDTGRQRQGTFSALGTLDSSAFQEQQFRSDQALAEDTGRTNLEKTRSVNEVETQLNTFRQKATSELSRLGLQYQQGKNAIAQAMAENNVEEAGAIANAIEQIRSRAQEVQNTMANFANQAALLKAQGFDVRTNIGGITGDGYAQNVNSFLSNMQNQAGQTYQVPQGEFEGQGYIYGKSGRQYRSREEALKAGDL